MSGVAAIVLAAGASRRFRAADPGVATKLVADLDGAPMIRRVVEAALASRARPVVIVTGHARAAVGAALDGLDVAFVHNAAFEAGLSTSLRLGLSALPPGAAGALVLLGDMPCVGPALLDRLIEAFAAEADAVVPVRAGRRGNPALIGRALFGPAASLTGDEGARRLLGRARVVEIAVDDDAVSVDIDDPATLRRVRAGLTKS